MVNKASSTEKIDFEVNKRAAWFFDLANFFKGLERGEVKFPLIPKDEFESLDSKEQIRLLKRALLLALKAVKVNVNKNIICHAHADSKPSMIVNIEKCDLHCFGCQENGTTTDIFDLLKVIFNLNTFPLQKQKAIELFVEGGKEITQAMQVRFNKKNNNNNNMNMPASTNKAFSSTTSNRVYINAWEDKECMDYLKSRGLSEEIIRQFKLMCWDYKANKYVIIPCHDKYCVRRKFKDGIGTYPKYWNKADVQITLFNADVFDNAEEGQTIFVFESAIDAMTAAQIANDLELVFHVVALNGLENFNMVLQKSNIIQSKMLKIAVILDNDATGISSSKKICTELVESKRYWYLHLYEKAGIAAFLTGFKDLNEAFVFDSSKASQAIKEIYEHLNSDFSEIETFDISDAEKINLLNSQSAISALEAFGIVKITSYNK